VVVKRIPASPSTVDRVSAELRDSIISGTLPPGEPFTIHEVTTQMGVSHIPVREAMRRLESEGLIEMRPGRSAIVRPVDAEEVQSIYRVRLALEPHLARLSRPRLRASDFAEAEALLEVYSGPTDVIRELNQHMEFHLILLRPAASEWDLRILRYLWQASERYVRLLFDPEDEALQARHLKRHRSLLEAARTASPSGMEQAIRQHLEQNETWLLQAITPAVARQREGTTLS
jgi:DNA-binding GntR family transcriptional regulator